jgi:RimJ/RimL family protein N-acetyltransferase
MCEYREVSENDYAGICNLIRSEEEMFLVYPNGRFPLTEAQLRELSRLRKELTVAVDGDRIIGFANLYDYRKCQSAFIGNVVIDVSYRGKGLGKGIVSYMLEQAFVRHDLPEVRISVFSENATALLLYTGLGFTPYGIEERQKRDGTRVALIHMKAVRECGAV